jgi:hypothetical protein
METESQAESRQRESPAMDASLLEWTCQVRDVLKGSGPMPLASVARRITDATTNEVAMAVGWLAHAGEIRFSRRRGLWEIGLQ